MAPTSVGTGSSSCSSVSSGGWLSGISSSCRPFSILCSGSSALSIERPRAATPPRPRPASRSAPGHSAPPRFNVDSVHSQRNLRRRPRGCDGPSTRSRSLPTDGGTSIPCAPGSEGSNSVSPSRSRSAWARPALPRFWPRAGGPRGRGAVSRFGLRRGPLRRFRRFCSMNCARGERRLLIPHFWQDEGAESPQRGESALQRPTDG